jgi:transglutaminase-like putative cysteine protease
VAPHRVTLLRPLPRALSRFLSVAVLVAWAASMGFLVRSLQASPGSLATDLARYGSAAVWRGIYYRGQKIGFSVSETSATSEGFTLQEDGRLQMSLLGATTAARVRTEAQLDTGFSLRAFSFSLDPGTGPIEVNGTVDGTRLQITIKTPSGTRTETRQLEQTPMLSINLARRLAATGLETGKRYQVAVFDPATLQNSPMVMDVGKREVVHAAGRPVPAFKVQMQFAGLTSTSWITDVGEVVREESPMGMIVLQETRDRAIALAVPGDVQTDMIDAVSIVPETKHPIRDPASVTRLRVRLTNAPAASDDLQGAGQTVTGDVFDVRDAETLADGPADPDLARFLAPEPFLESDAPEIVAEAARAVAGATDARTKAERLVRYVNSILEKKPTVSLPSAREVLRTRVGDCNEHTALYVAMARASGVPARIAVGLVALQGSFYYHAWPEVYVASSRTAGHWLPVDPTLNQYPADPTHIRLARGGLDRQALIMPMIGRARMTILDLEEKAEANPVLVGRTAADTRPLEIPIPRLDGSGNGCWSRPAR